MSKNKEIKKLIKETVIEALLKEDPRDFGFGAPETPEELHKDKLQTVMFDRVRPFLIGYYRDQGLDQRAAAGKAEDKYYDLEELVIDAMMKFSL